MTDPVDPPPIQRTDDSAARSNTLTIESNPCTSGNGKGEVSISLIGKVVVGKSAI
jgi:hypothetical protein